MTKEAKKMITEQREEMKERRSPSFLKNKKKSVSPVKEATHDKKAAEVKGITSVKEVAARGNKVPSIPGINIFKVERVETTKVNPEFKPVEIKNPSFKQLKVESNEAFGR